jgi:hypothetical protein
MNNLTHHHIVSIMQMLFETNWSYPYRFEDTAAGQAVLALNQNERVLLIVEIAKQLTKTPKRDHQDGPVRLQKSLFNLLSFNPLLSHDDLIHILQSFLGSTYLWNQNVNSYYYLFKDNFLNALPNLVKMVEEYAKRQSLTNELQSIIAKLCLKLESEPNYHPREIFQLRIVGQGSPITLGEAWSDVAVTDIERLSVEQKLHWRNLLIHCAQARQSKPSAKWLRTAQAELSEIGQESFCQAIVKWFPLVDLPRTQPFVYRGYTNDPNLLLIHDVNADILKGLVWLCTGFNSTDVARAVAALAFSGYRRMLNADERCVRLGNACVWVLGQMSIPESINQLAILKARVKHGTAQKEITKALSVVCEKTGQSLTTLTEAAIPDYGLSPTGQRQEQIGDFTATLAVVGSVSVDLRWHRADGKQQKSVPKSVKDCHADALSALKLVVEDIKKMLSVQRDRLESFYLQPCTWDYPTWRQNYLEHPLVGTLSRRLIWQFRQQDKITAAIWWQEQLVTVKGTPLTHLDSDTIVDLWHPISAGTNDIPISEVTSWREWLLTHEVQQPFKQAHREVYLLTAAEKKTRSYSNRFVAHIVKQSQFNALCKARGWKYRTFFPFDDCRELYSQAQRQLSEWGLQAELWIDAITDQVEDTSAMAYSYLTTDKVKFCTLEGRRSTLPLAKVPAIVFSEVMRDVDLFVGVASIGSDPNWQSGGRPQRYNTYWHDYAFGQLSPTAETRRQLLETLVPKLKIADVCQVTQRFLIVTGKLNTYKIHLGSGNILMEPNDQYLCIVPKRKSDQSILGIFLPFEGDSTLSIILSKAFLLSEDDKIEDDTILSQIRRDCI